jgi:hypothetical protein
MLKRTKASLFAVSLAIAAIGAANQSLAIQTLSTNKQNISNDFQIAQLAKKLPGLIKGAVSWGDTALKGYNLFQKLRPAPQSQTFPYPLYTVQPTSGAAYVPPGVYAAWNNYGGFNYYDRYSFQPIGFSAFNRNTQRLDYYNAFGYRLQ